MHLLDYLLRLFHFSRLLEKTNTSVYSENTMLFKKMWNSLRLIYLCEIHTRLSSIRIKSFAFSQNYQPLTTFWQIIACRLIQNTFHFYSDLSFHSQYHHNVQAILLGDVDNIKQDRMYPHIQLTKFDKRNQNLNTLQSQCNQFLTLSRTCRQIH